MSSILDKPLNDIIAANRKPRKTKASKPNRAGGKKNIPSKVRGGAVGNRKRSNSTGSESKVCYAFQEGSCKYGDSCRFEHDGKKSIVRVIKQPAGTTQNIFSRIGTTQESGTSITFENLQTDITESDIEELCQTVGDVLSVKLRKGKNGRSTGVAEVIFERRSAAIQAVKKFSSLTLDGVPLKCELTSAKVYSASETGVKNPFDPSDAGKTFTTTVNLGGGGGRRTVVKPIHTARVSQESLDDQLEGYKQGKATGNDKKTKGKAAGKGTPNGGKGRGGKLSAEVVEDEFEKYLAQRK